MRTIFPVVLVGALAGAMGLTGCATAGGGEGGETTIASQPAVAADETRSERSATADKEAVPESAATRTAEAATEPRSSWREGRGSTTARESRDSRDERAAADTGSRREAGAATAARSGAADPVAQLTEVSRELAALRVANAKLKSERDRALQAGSNARAAEPAARVEARVDPADEKIAEILKSYGNFKQELAAYVAGIEKAKQENAAANAKVKDAAARADEAKADVARLERDLRAERRARAEAETTVKKLQEQLGVIAQALEKAGLSVDKLGAGKDGASRRE